MLNIAVKYDSQLVGVNSKVAVSRITALWAFTETAFGGLLHSFHVPLKGIFIGGFAIIFITLIAFISEQKYSIIKSTIIVLIVKGVVSPYTPIAAYFSLFLQGMLGQVLFANKKYFSISAFVLSLSSMLLFGFQKVIIYTIIFGRTLWYSIDTFTNYIFDQLNVGGESFQTVHFSLILISVYVFTHLVAGFFMGIIAGRIPYWIVVSMTKNDYYIKDIQNELNPGSIFATNKKNKNFPKKTRVIIFLIASIGALIFSYLIPQYKSNLLTEVALMLFRAIIIILIWYFYLAPLLIKYSKIFLKKQQNIYAEEVKEIITLFPLVKNVLSHCWIKSSEHKGFQKYRLFISYSIITILLTNFNFE